MTRLIARISSENRFLGAVLLAAGAAAIPLLAESGLLNTRGGGDSPFLLLRLHQLVTALEGGHFPVRWMPDANYGFGYPFFNYYAPLSIYVAAAFRFLGLTFIGAIKSAQLLGFLVAGWAMFQLGRSWFGNRWAGLLAAVSYTFAPFHLVNVYVRGDSLAEFWAMALYPLVLLAADRLLRSRKPGTLNRDLLPLALAYAALILSHNISALIYTPFLLAYLGLGYGHLVLRERKSATGESGSPGSQAATTLDRLTLFVAPILALGLGLALSAWFWLPALGERSLVQLEPVTSGYFHYNNHFRSADLVQSSLFTDYAVSGGRAFAMSLLQTIGILLGLGVLLAARLSGRRILRRGRLVYLVLGLLVATFMITPYSRSLWDGLPLLPFVQFPWRFLSLQALFGAIATAGLALLPGRRLLVPVTVATFFLSGLGNLETDHLLIADSDVTPERLVEYEWFTGNIGSTVSAEYLPYSVQPRPYTSRWLEDGDRWSVLELDNGLSSAQLLARQATRQTWRLATLAPRATVALPTMYWPGWQAAIDGEAVTVRPSPSSGLITLELPSGSHNVELRLRRSPIQLGAELVSLATIFFALWLARPIRAAMLSRTKLSLFTVLVVSVVAVGWWPERSLSGETLTWDFGQFGYLHHDEAGVRFDNGAILLGYHYSSDQVTAGESLTIITNWADAGIKQATMLLATPAITRFADAPSIATQSQSLAAQTLSFELKVPDNAPSGMYAPRLTLSDGRPLTPSGQPRGDLFLRPFRVNDRLLPVQATDRPLEARTVSAVQRDGSAFDLQLQWLTANTLPYNYNVSLRLKDFDGLEVAFFDAQPGYGFEPSSGWAAGQWVDDWLALPVSTPLAGQEPYALVASLYDLTSGDVALARRLGEVITQGEALAFRPNEPDYDVPADLSALAATFGEVIRLRGYQLDQAEYLLTLTLYWEAAEAIKEDYVHFAHLVDRQTGQIAAQHDSMPQNNSYPTSQWSRGEVVADRMSIDLAGLEPGVYDVAVGLYQNVDGRAVPLAAVDGSGRPVQGDGLAVPEAVVIGGE